MNYLQVVPILNIHQEVGILTWVSGLTGILTALVGLIIGMKELSFPSLLHKREKWLKKSLIEEENTSRRSLLIFLLHRVTAQLVGRNFIPLNFYLRIFLRLLLMIVLLSIVITSLPFTFITVVAYVFFIAIIITDPIRHIIRISVEYNRIILEYRGRTLGTNLPSLLPVSLNLEAGERNDIDITPLSFKMLSSKEKGNIKYEVVLSLFMSTALVIAASGLAIKFNGDSFLGVLIFLSSLLFIIFFTKKIVSYINLCHQIPLEVLKNINDTSEELKKISKEVKDDLKEFKLVFKRDKKELRGEYKEFSRKNKQEVKRIFRNIKREQKVEKNLILSLEDVEWVEKELDSENFRSKGRDLDGEGKRFIFDSEGIKYIKKGYKRTEEELVSERARLLKSLKEGMKRSQRSDENRMRKKLEELKKQNKALMNLVK